MYGCERCQHLDLGKERYGGRDLRLFGEFSTSLCNKCSNDWYNFCQNDPLYLEYIKLDYKVKIIEVFKDPRDREELVEISTRSREIQHEFFKKGKEFVLGSNA